MMALLNKKANPNCQNKMMETPLILAANCGHTEIINVLLLSNADTSIGDNIGYTPLHTAAAADEMETVELLLQHGADPTIKNKDGQKASAVTKNEEIIALLKKGPPKGPAMI